MNLMVTKLVQGSSRRVPIKVNDIVHLTGLGSYTQIVLSSGESIVMSRTLKTYQNRLPDFLRVNKQTLVNPIFVRQFKRERRADESFILMNNDTKYKISRRRFTGLWQKWLTYKYPKHA